MKFSLQKSGRKRQEAIREAIRSGVPLAGMLAAAAFTLGAGEKEAPTAKIGEPPATESRQPAVPGKPVVAGAMLPPPPPPLQLPKETVEYTVRNGDTLLGIAKQHGTTLAVLKALNQLTDEGANRLQIGQKLRVPKKQPKGTGQ